MQLLWLGLLALSLVTDVSSQSFTNPIIQEGFPDNDVFLGPDNKTFYFSSSNFHYSPGTPILQSIDIANLEGIMQVLRGSNPFLFLSANRFI